MKVQDAIEQAYKNGYEAGVKSVTDNNVGGKMTPTDKDTNVLTNADRIRAMSDEELADFITSQNRGICTDICREMHYQSNLEWLKQPAEVDNGQA